VSDLPAIGGELAQAGLTARALEPAHGEGDGHTHEANCLNCSALLDGPFCRMCGQRGHVHRTLGAFFHDLVHGLFHFEGKTWRTLPQLIWRPGRLTREYIEGRRASYVSPIALFLFCVFLLFAVVKTLDVDPSDFTTVEVNGKTIKGLEANERELARLRQERANLVAERRPTEKVDGEIEGREGGIELMRKMREGGSAAVMSLPEDDEITGISAIDHVIAKARANPQLAIYKLQTSAYKYSWALIPISVPFVWLLFAWRRRFGLYDHTVFVTYSLCFMSLLLTVAMAMTGLGIPGGGLLLFFVPPVHIYRQLREAYTLTRFGAAWRTVATLMIAWLVLSLFAILLIAEELG